MSYKFTVMAWQSTSEIQPGLVMVYRYKNKCVAEWNLHSKYAKSEQIKNFTTFYSWKLNNH